MKLIEDKILAQIKESSLLLKKSSRLNIYILGVTGVGKTCLKNAICNKKYSAEKFEERRNNKRETFICECHNFLSFTDNMGFELKGNYDLKNLVIDTQKYLMKKAKSNDEAIHCIWYCLTGTRLQNEEYKVICNLRGICKENNIPLIFIYTQAIEHDNIQNMKNFINEKLKSVFNEEIEDDPENVQFIGVLSKQTTVKLGNFTSLIKPYNLSKLIEKTFYAYEYSVNLVNKKCLIELIKEKIKNEYENKLQSCFEIIANENITEENFYYVLGILCIQLMNYRKIKTQFLGLNLIKDKILSFISEKI